jgi:hypothetical protein
MTKTKATGLGPPPWLRIPIHPKTLRRILLRHILLKQLRNDHQPHTTVRAAVAPGQILQVSAHQPQDGGIIFRQDVLIGKMMLRVLPVRHHKSQHLNKLILDLSVLLHDDELLPHLESDCSNFAVTGGRLWRVADCEKSLTAGTLSLAGQR